MGSYLGHNISALVTREVFDETIPGRLFLPVFRYNDVSIIGLHADVHTYWEREWNWEYDNYKSDAVLEDNLTLRFSEMMRLNSFAFVATEYFGGVGEQWASLPSKQGWKPLKKKNPINLALKKIGVKSTSGMDEFEVSGLNNHRHFDDNIPDWLHCD